jgi:hypothetical protein
MIRVLALLLCLGFLTTSCSTTHRARQARFDQPEQANLIVRYYTDDTSYLLKPAAKDGPFLAVLKRDAILEVARQLPSRELAVVVMIDRGSEREVEFVRQKWEGLLTEAGYQRVVFLRASKGMDIKGLPVLAYGG